MRNVEGGRPTGPQGWSCVPTEAATSTHTRVAGGYLRAKLYRKPPVVVFFWCIYVAEFWRPKKKVPKVVVLVF